MFKNLPIRLKMAFMYAVISIFTFLLLFFTLYMTGKQYDAQLRLSDSTIVEVDAAGDMKSALAEQQALYMEAFVYIDHANRRDGYLAEAEAEGARFEESRALLSDSSAVDSPYAEYTSLKQSLLSGLQTRDLLGALESLEAMKAAAESVGSALDTYAAREIADAKAETAAIRAELDRNNMLYVLYLIVYFICIFVTGRKIANMVAKPLQELGRKAQEISEGDVNVDFVVDRRDEIGKLTVQMKAMVEGMQEQQRVLNTIAEGDFTAQIVQRSDKDAINGAIQRILDTNNQVLSNITAASREVSQGAAQIAQGAQSLASASGDQAASVDRFSDTIRSVHRQTEATEQTANEAMKITNETSRRVEESIASMKEMLEAMDAIDESSTSITKVIKTIEDIAFQTNILALNAAVEAARAGQYGKGFAVVADEVGNLSKKSTAAAKETAELIEGSARKVKDGNRLLERTSGQLADAGSLADENRALMEQLARDAGSQSASISELQEGIAQISNVVQVNSATAEESASSAQEMNAQSALLSDIVSRFVLRDSGGKTLQSKVEQPRLTPSADDEYGKY